MSKRTELIRNGVATVVAFVIGVCLVEYGLKLPDKLDERRERALRNGFCEKLLHDDKVGALALIPDTLQGKPKIARFVNLPGKIVECKDSGQPSPVNSPGPGDCLMFGQSMAVNRLLIPDAAHEQTEGRITFAYACTAFSSWKRIEEISGYTTKVRFNNGIRTAIDGKGFE